MSSLVSAQCANGSYDDIQYATVGSSTVLGVPDGTTNAHWTSTSVEFSTPFTTGAEIIVLAKGKDHTVDGGRTYIVELSSADGSETASFTFSSTFIDGDTSTFIEFKYILMASESGSYTKMKLGNTGTGGMYSDMDAITVKTPTCYTCKAGAGAPILSKSTGGGNPTFNLSTVNITNTAPAGTTVTWHTGTPATTANKVTPTIAAIGTYYAAFYHTASDCYSYYTAIFNVIADNDNDGIPDVVDVDDDNDGIPDIIECPNTELLVNGGFDYTDVELPGKSAAATGITGKYHSHLNNVNFNSVAGNTGKYQDWDFGISGSSDTPDWSEGQYLAGSSSSYKESGVWKDYKINIKQSNAGGGFLIFSLSGEKVEKNMNNLKVGETYVFEFEMGSLPNYRNPSKPYSYDINYLSYGFLGGATILHQTPLDTTVYTFDATTPNVSTTFDPHWKKYRIVFVANQTSLVYQFLLNGETVALVDSFSLKEVDNTCTNDTNTDSDGDGCADGVEAGLTPADITGGVGLNGLYDSLETFADSGILKNPIDLTTNPYNANSQGSACATCTNPDDSLIVNNPTVCKGSEASITITNAAAGVSYQLRLESDDSDVSGASATQLATGDLTLKVTPTTTTVYNIYATKGTCNIELINKVTVTINTCKSTATDDNFSGNENGGDITGNVIKGDNGNGVDIDTGNPPLTVISATVDINGDGIPTALTLGIATPITVSGTEIGTLTLNINGDLVFAPKRNYNGTVPTIKYVVTDRATANIVITVVAKGDVDGDGVSNSLDLDNDNDGILDAEEDANCTGSIVEEIIINETFEAGTVGAVIPKGSLVGVPGIDGLQEAYNSNPGNTSTTNVGDYKSITGVDGNPSIVIDANGGGIVDREQMSSFIVLNKVNLLNGEKYTVESDFSLGLQYSGSTLAKESNEYGIAIGAPGQDPIWKEDYAGAPDGVFLYGHGSVLIREPNSSLPNFTAPPRVKGWFRQSATYYVKDNGSGILHLYADNKGYKYNAAGVLGAPFIANEIDLGAASNYPWLNNAAISVSTDEYVDNVVVKINHCDNDNDGIPNYLDTDSDNDGCPDAIEANENVTLAQLDADKRIDIANQGGVDINGVPNLVNSGGTADNSNNTQGQGTNTAVLTATKIEVKTQPTNKTICLGENAVFTAEMSSKSTTVFNAGVPDYTGITGNTTGLVYQWEEQIEGAGSWNVISNGGIYSNATTASLKLTNPPLAASTNKYRLVTTSTSNTCAEVISDEVEIVVNPTSVAGTIAGAGAVCTGTNSTELTLSGHTGTVVKWQSSTDNFVSSSDISNSTTTLTLTNLSVATKYRAVVKSGTCSTATTPSVEMTITPTSVAGTIAGAGAVCTGTNSTELTLSGHTGTVVKWQSSTDNF
ncbi:Ig-like domain-containing protein, partial [Tenacibaculum finnmarkense]|uniref:Ig-like domain-containing protein n=1 Tax=Tenacibaculum finnmarkense TaxID=2781243 RepID=UPI0018E940CA